MIRPISIYLLDMQKSYPILTQYLPKDLIDDPDFKAMYNKLTFGYQAGIGVDIIKRLTVDLRYEGSLQKYQTQIQNLAGDKFNLDDRPNAFLLSVGLMF